MIGDGVHIECGSTLNVGLTGMFRTLIQESTGMVPPFLRLILAHPGPSF